MQNIGVCERNPDLSDARLAVIRFPVSGSDRGVTVHFHGGGDLLTYEDLDARVRAVYATWARVCDESAAAKRRRRVEAEEGRLFSCDAVLGYEKPRALTDWAFTQI